jgi:hypothetical protein
MNLRPPFHVLTALAIAGAATAADPQAPDPVATERIRAAFLEDAPATVAKSMQQVLADECERVRDDPPKRDRGEPVDIDWLCGGKPLRFLREVLVNGVRIDDGYICDARNLEAIKFVPLDLIEHQRCVWVSVDNQSESHDLDLDTQLRDAVE